MNKKRATVYKKAIRPIEANDNNNYLFSHEIKTSLNE